MEGWISLLLHRERNVRLNKSLRYLWIKKRSKALEKFVKSLLFYSVCHISIISSNQATDIRGFVLDLLYCIGSLLCIGSDNYQRICHDRIRFYCTAFYHVCIFMCIYLFIHSGRNFEKPHLKLKASQKKFNLLRWTFLAAYMSQKWCSGEEISTSVPVPLAACCGKFSRLSW